MKTKREIDTYIVYYKFNIKKKKKLIQDYQKKWNKLIEKEKYKDLPFYAPLISWNNYEMEAQELCLKGLKKIDKANQIDQLIEDYSKKIDKQKRRSTVWIPISMNHPLRCGMKPLPIAI